MQVVGWQERKAEIIAEKIGFKGLIYVMHRRNHTTGLGKGYRGNQQ
jgi:hypothetical protein